MCNTPNTLDELLECTDPVCVELLTPKYSYIQINIGRNIGNRPMSAQMWDLFQLNIADTIHAASAPYGEATIETHYGVGKWDGIPEESAHISATIQGNFNLPRVRDALKQIKGMFKQDSIALITDSELI